MKFYGEIITSCIETSVHARKPHVNSHKNYIIETQKIKKVHAQCADCQISTVTVLSSLVNWYISLLIEKKSP